MLTFRDAGLPHLLAQALEAHKICQATAIQERTLADAVAGSSIIGQAETGSGKTLAFIIPMLARLIEDPQIPRVSRPGHPRAVAIAPTRELVAQIYQQCSPLASAVGLRSVFITGGVAVHQQRTRLAAPADIVIATPGRLHDVIDQGLIRLDAVRICTLDEVDHLIDGGFWPDVQKILGCLTEARTQFLLFSATVTDRVRAIAPGANEHSIGEATPGTGRLRHTAIVVNNAAQRRHCIERFARSTRPLIMFASTRDEVRRISSRFRMHYLHSECSQSQRTFMMSRFKRGEFTSLVCTDVISRGIDIPQCDVVVHMGLPFDATSFLHRSGRTARNGRAGHSVVVIQPDDADRLRELLREAGVAAQFVDGGSSQCEKLLATLCGEGRSSHTKQGSRAKHGLRGHHASRLTSRTKHRQHKKT